MGSNLEAVTNLRHVIVQNSLIENCYIHDTQPARAGFGAGIQLKPGCNNNIVRNNVFERNLIGPFFYDTFDMPNNVAYNNLIIASTDNCMQCTAGCSFYNNIGMNCGNNGIQIASNQLMTGKSPRFVSFVFVLQWSNF